MRDQQGEWAREIISKEVSAMHRMMGCTWYGSVCKSICVQNMLGDHRRPMCSVSASSAKVKQEEKRQK